MLRGKDMQKTRIWLAVLFFLVMGAPTVETASGLDSLSAAGQSAGKAKPGQELKDFSADKINACFKCHGENAEMGPATRFARQLYDTSGHNLGMRTQTATGSPEAVAFDEGTGAYTARSNMTLPGLGLIACNGCHNEKSFKETLGLKKQNYNNSGALPAVSNPIKIECFTCHEPHTNNDYSIVKHGADPVALGDGITTFVGGKGNLCARCHRQVNGPSVIAALDSSTDRPLFTWGHRPQAAEMLLGAGYIPFTEDYKGTGAALNYKDEKGYPHSKVADSCVGCHMLKDSATGPLAGHNFYLTDYRSDISTGCKTCHETAFNSANPFGGVG
jgi:cytochrome c553